MLTESAGSEIYSLVALLEALGFKLGINIADIELSAESSSGGIPVTTGGTTSSGTENVNISSGFNFSFDQAQMEQMWQQMASQINTSITVTDDPNEKKEAYWDNLEKWLLKGYQTQAKDLGMRVARLDFMFKTLTQQMEVSFNQNFHNWSGYFNKTLNDLFISRVPALLVSR
jgi:hypothetical protein